MGTRSVRSGRRRADDVDRGRVKIRRAGGGDAPRLAQLHAQAHDAGMALGATRATNLEELHRSALAQTDRVVLVAERDGEIVGMAHLVPSEAANAPHRAEVQRVAVAENARGSGVGRALMTAIEDAALERGITLLWLTTHEGSDACAFYETVGYTKLGVMPQHTQRPDGTRAPGAFYFRELAATVGS